MNRYVSRGEQFVPKTVEAVIGRRYWLTDQAYTALDLLEHETTEEVAK